MTGDSGAGQTTSLTLGEVVRAALPDFAQTHRLPAHHWKVLRAIAACHTPALGGHQYECAHCGRAHFVPHSCGNRHCASCQRLKGAQWLEAECGTKGSLWNTVSSGTASNGQYVTIQAGNNSTALTLPAVIAASASGTE